MPYDPNILKGSHVSGSHAKSAFTLEISNWEASIAGRHTKPAFVLGAGNVDWLALRIPWRVEPIPDRSAVQSREFQSETRAPHGAHNLRSQVCCLQAAVVEEQGVNLYRERCKGLGIFALSEVIAVLGRPTADLSQCYMGTPGVHAFAHALSCNTVVRELILRNNGLTDQACPQSITHQAGVWQMQ